MSLPPYSPGTVMPEQAHLAQLRPQVLREHVVVVDLRRARRDLGVGEAAHGVAQGVDFFAERKGAWDPWTSESDECAGRLHYGIDRAAKARKPGRSRADLQPAQWPPRMRPWKRGARAAQRQLQLADRADALFGQAVGGLVGRDRRRARRSRRCARGCGRSCASCASRARGCSRRSPATRSSRRPRSPRSPARTGCRASATSSPMALLASWLLAAPQMTLHFRRGRVFSLTVPPSAHGE